MTQDQDPNSTDPRPRHGRGLGWAALVVGVLFCLGVVSSVTSGNTDTSGAAETAGLVVGRLILLAIGVAGIVYGVRRLSR